jgi:two-component sensor histidine kinase
VHYEGEDVADMTTIEPDGRGDYRGAQLLLAELAHRISNEYTLVIAKLSLVAARSSHPDTKCMLEEACECVRNFSRVHRALQMPTFRTRVDARDYMRKVCLAISRSRLESRNITLQLIERPLEMDSEQCWRVALILCELVTNAVKHAFGEGGGLIRVEISSSGGTVECRVEDNGTAVAAHMEPGRGLRIIKALVRELGGTLDHRIGCSGSMFAIAFPEHRTSAMNYGDEVSDVWSE